MLFTLLDDNNTVSEKIEVTIVMMRESLHCLANPYRMLFMLFPLHNYHIFYVHESYFSFYF